MTVVYAVVGALVVFVALAAWFGRGGSGRGGGGGD
jgi:hypothetical protein